MRMDQRRRNLGFFFDESVKRLPDKVAVMLRRWALSWLRDDLAAYGTMAQQSNPAVKRAVQQRLTHWQTNPDLTGVRDKAGLANLPDTEREAWEKLWADVEALRNRALATK